MLLRCLCVVVLLLAGSVSLTAAGAPDLVRAETLVREGYTAMQASNQDSSRSVDAALAFASALPIFEAAEDYDRARELQANIFWCRKRMNHDNLERFLRSKNDSGMAAVVQRVEAITNQVVAKEDAGRWLAEADEFAQGHPDQAFAIAVRYFEVAERFVGTEASLTAQRKSLDYQAKASASAGKVQRETLFTRPVVPPAGRQPVPAAAEVKAAQQAVRKLFKEDFANRSEDGRQALAIKLVEQARSTRDDPTSAFAMFEEALALAESLRDFNLLLSATDELAARFEIDAGQVKRTRLTRVKSDPVAAAILKLLDDPADVAANTVAGRYFAFDCRAWENGFAMLSGGSDAALAKLAEMELARPEGVIQMVELGDAWYALGGAKNDPAIACWERAMRWYEQALPQLSGVSKARTQERMDSMFGVVFPVQQDWTNLTAEQWDKIKGVAIVVAGNRSKTESAMVLKSGQRARVVPHPTDTWEFRNWNGNGSKVTTWKGEPRDTDMDVRVRYADEDDEFPLGSLIMFMDPQKRALAGVITGPGKIMLASSQPARAIKGQIRVKIIRLND